MKRNPVFLLIHSSTLLLLSCLAVGSFAWAGEIALAGKANAKTKGKTPAKEYTTVIRPYLNTHCFSCHGPKEQEGKLRLDTLSLDMGNSKQIAIWEEVRTRLVDQDMPPDPKPLPPKAATKRVISWITQKLKHAAKEDLNILPPDLYSADRDMLFHPSEDVAAATPTRLWLLSSPTYRWWMTDVLWPNGPTALRSHHAFGWARTVYWQSLDAPFGGGGGYIDHSSERSISPSMFSILRRNANVIASHLLNFRMPGMKAPFSFGYRGSSLTGSPKSRKALKVLLNEKNAITTAHLEAVITSHFQLILLRAPSDTELPYYAGLLKKCMKEGGRREGLSAIISALLLLPEVLYRSERGAGEADQYGRRMLTPHELTFAIAFALTDRRPDRVLRKAALTGRLGTREEIRAQVYRILTDHRMYKPRIMRFFRQWLGYGKAGKVFKDEKLRRTYLAKSGAYFGRYAKQNIGRAQGGLADDADYLIEYILEEDRNVLEELLSTNKAFISYNPNEPHKTGRIGTFDKFFVTQGFYGLKKADKELALEQPFTLPEDQRAGILTHPSWLLTHTFNDHTKPIHRGIWIYENLLGAKALSAPEGVSIVIPKELLGKPMRQQLQVTRKTFCWQCHSKVNPLGLSLEMYDHFGRYRTVEQGKPVDSSGGIVSSGEEGLDGPVKDGVELLKKLSTSKRARQSFIRQAFRYWMGRAEKLRDGPTLVAAEKAYVDSNGSMKELLLSLLTSDSFLYRIKRSSETSNIQSIRRGKP